MNADSSTEKYLTVIKERSGLNKTPTLYKGYILTDGWDKFPSILATESFHNWTPKSPHNTTRQSKKTQLALKVSSTLAKEKVIEDRWSTVEENELTPMLKTHSRNKSRLSAQL